MDRGCGLAREGPAEPAVREGDDTTTQLELALGPRCYYCAAPADYLCDGIVARVADPDNIEVLAYFKGAMERALRTCDRPLCQGCIEDHSPVYWHFSDGTGAVDGQDYCPQCVREQRHRMHMDTSPLVLAARADAIRARRLVPGMDRHYRVAFPGRKK